MEFKAVLKLDLSVNDENFPNKRTDKKIGVIKPIGKTIQIVGTEEEIIEDISLRVKSVIETLEKLYYGEEETVNG